ELEPGPYQVAAARDGFLKSTVGVEVAPSGTYRVDFLLAADYPPARASAPVADAAVVDELAALKKRIEQLEAALQARTPGGAERSEPVAVAAATALPVPAQAPQAAAPPAPAPAPQHVLPEALEA